METRFRRRMKVALKGVLEIDKYFKRKVALAKGNRLEATVCDITEDGACITTEYYLPKELTVGLTIKDLPFGLKQAMTVIGEVRYCNNIEFHRYQCGIKFLALHMKYKKAISKFVSYHHKA